MHKKITDYIFTGKELFLEWTVETLTTHADSSCLSDINQSIVSLTCTPCSCAMQARPVAVNDSAERTWRPHNGRPFVYGSVYKNLLLSTFLSYLRVILVPVCFLPDPTRTREKLTRPVPDPRVYGYGYGYVIDLRQLFTPAKSTPAASSVCLSTHAARLHCPLLQSQRPHIKQTYISHLIFKTVDIDFGRVIAPDRTGGAYTVLPALGPYI